MPKVSICVPVYNVEQYIGRCIESIQNQTMLDIEIIFVNDCTPDNSMEIVRKYAEMDSRIVIIEHDENHGLMVARKSGYRAAVGEYITFLDSDDTLPSNAIEDLYSAAKNNDADIVSGTIQYVPISKERFLWPNQLRFGTDKVSIYRSLLLDECGHNLCSRLFKRELLQKFSYQTFEGATNGEDGILFYQVVNNSKKMITIDKIVYEYYQNSESSSQIRYGEKALRSISILNAIRVETAGAYPELTVLLNKKITGVLFYLKSSGYNMATYIKENKLQNYDSLFLYLKCHGLKALLKNYLRTVVTTLRRIRK